MKILSNRKKESQSQKDKEPEKRFDFMKKKNIVSSGYFWVVFIYHYLLNMAMDLNKVMIIGRATNNLQSKTIESTGIAVVNFTVATNRKFKNKEGNIVENAEYHRCVAYGKGAEVLEKYLKKGKRIYIEGRLRTRKRQDSEGVDKYYTEIIVDSFIFLDTKGEGVGETTEEITSEEVFDEEAPF